MTFIAILAWIAVMFEMTGNWLIGDKRRWAFLVKIAGNIAWLSVSVLSGIHGLTASALLGLVISSRNFMCWRKDAR